MIETVPSPTGHRTTMMMMILPKNEWSEGGGREKREMPLFSGLCAPSRENNRPVPRIHRLPSFSSLIA